MTLKIFKLDPGLLAKSEFRIIGYMSILLLLTWIFLATNAFPANPPLNRQFARYLSVGFILTLAILEYSKPAWGLYALLATWPFMPIARELCALHVRTWFNDFPVCWHGPSFAALASAVFIRAELRGNSTSASNGSGHKPSLAPCQPVTFKFFRAMLWVLLSAWLLSAILMQFTVARRPDGWIIDYQDWTSFFSASPVSSLLPLYETLAIVPAMLFALLCLNLCSMENQRQSRDLCYPSEKIVTLILSITGFLVALHIIVQAYLNISWSFDQAPPSGPFSHRNSAAAFILVTLVIFAADTFCHPSKKALIFVPLTFIYLWALFLSNSRAALLSIASLAVLAILTNLRPWRIAFAGVLLAALVYFLLFCPLPDFTKIESPTLRRIVATGHYIRWGDLSKITSDRQSLYRTALSITADHPFVGSGVGSFGMLNHPDARYGQDHATSTIYAAHSMPLHLSAEIGVPGSLAWMLIHIVLPSVLIFTRPNRRSIAFPLLAIGVINIFDTSWLTPGLTGLAAVLIVLLARWSYVQQETNEPC